MHIGDEPFAPGCHARVLAPIENVCRRMKIRSGKSEKDTKKHYNRELFNRSIKNIYTHAQSLVTLKCESLCEVISKASADTQDNGFSNEKRSCPVV